MASGRPARVQNVPAWLRDYAVGAELDEISLCEKPTAGLVDGFGKRQREKTTAGWCSQDRTWKPVFVDDDGKRKALGTYTDQDSAYRALDSAARQQFGSNAHGRLHPNGHNRIWLYFPTSEETAAAAKRKRDGEQRLQLVTKRFRTQGGVVSSFRGVGWCGKQNKWKAQIKVHGNTCVLGRFDSEEEAARAFDRKARETHGDRAQLNFPSLGEQGLSAPRTKAAHLCSSRFRGVLRYHGPGGLHSKPSNPQQRAQRKGHAKSSSFWLVMIQQTSLGVFNDETVAARVYDEAARSAYGARAIKIGLNFPQQSDSVSIDEQEEVCAICLESLDTGNLCLTPCNHQFHLDCVTDWLTSSSSSSCPLCANLISLDELKPQKFGTMANKYLRNAKGEVVATKDAAIP